jgi:hypothetical protein
MDYYSRRSEEFKRKGEESFRLLERVKTAEFLSEKEFIELADKCSSTHQFLAARPEATPELLDMLVDKSSSLLTLVAVCKNPKTSTETLRKIWLKNIRNTEHLIASHPNCSKEFWNFDTGRKFLSE